MGKYTKLILIASALVLALASLTLLKSDKNKIKFDLKENEVIIDNFEMGKVLDEQNNFYKVTAKQARINRDKETAKLTDFKAVYKKEKTDVELFAPQGYLEKERMVSVNGVIQGRVNELDFLSEKDGRFHYDFMTGVGTMLGRFQINHNNGNISADKMLIYSKKNDAEFIGHVQVTYYK
jgi:lipopolysaccharide export system protein LptC